MPKNLNITALRSHDLETGGSLGNMEYPAFNEFITNHGEKTGTVWTLLSALSDYAAGEKVKQVGLLTPRGQDGLEPFIFRPEVGSSFTEELLIVDGLYKYMSHPSKLVIYGFGESKRNVVNELLNDHIDTVQSAE